MEVSFHGVRGAIPVPGPETRRYGGNTSCVAVRTGGGDLLVLDAGTGIIGLGRELMTGALGRGEGQAALLLTHAHWDHIQGFPFFAPVFMPGNRLVIYGPGWGPGHGPAALEGILEGQMNPHYSPLHTIRNLGAAIELVTASGSGEAYSFGEATLRAHANPHGATPALAWRVEATGRALVYAPDAGYDAERIPEASLALYHGADLLVHDCTYTPEDRAGREKRGHASLREAVAAAVRADVRHLVLTHYEPDYGDDLLDALAERARSLLDAEGGRAIALTAAREGLTIAL